MDVLPHVLQKGMAIGQVRRSANEQGSRLYLYSEFNQKTQKWRLIATQGYDKWYNAIIPIIELQDTCDRLAAWLATLAQHWRTGKLLFYAEGKEEVRLRYDTPGHDYKVYLEGVRHNVDRLFIRSQNIVPSLYRMVVAG